jgi:hypothetical protein
MFHHFINIDVCSHLIDSEKINYVYLQVTRPNKWYIVHTQVKIMDGFPYLCPQGVPHTFKGPPIFKEAHDVIFSEDDILACYMWCLQCENNDANDWLHWKAFDSWTLLFYVCTGFWACVVVAVVTCSLHCQCHFKCQMMMADGKKSEIGDTTAIEMATTVVCYCCQEVPKWWWQWQDKGW